MTYHLRYRQDASGYVARWAGMRGSADIPTAAEAEQIRHACMNGNSMEVVETEATT